MKVIHTDNNSIADHLIEQWFNEVKEQKIVYFSNQIQLNKLRLEHIRKNIIIDSVDLNGEIVTVLDDGSLDYCPEGYFDHSFNIVIEIEEALLKNNPIGEKIKLKRLYKNPDAEKSLYSKQDSYIATRTNKNIFTPSFNVVDDFGKTRSITLDRDFKSISWEVISE